jgi:Flp pilus assembly protein TadD
VDPLQLADPTQPDLVALRHEARDQLVAGHIPGAKRTLEMVLAQTPDDAATLSLYGLCFAREGVHFEMALQLCGRAVALSPRDVELLVNLGRVHRLMGDRQTAHDLFFQAWRIDPTHVGPAAELARMGVRRGPVLPFLDRTHPWNRRLGRVRNRLERQPWLARLRHLF